MLDRMITFRLHIDAAAEDNGCLSVIPGTHRYGIVTNSEIGRVVSDAVAIPCVVDAGDAVVMRPHILHSSRKAFVLVRFENMTQLEAARQLGISRPAVTKHIAKATKELLEALLKDDAG